MHRIEYFTGAFLIAEKLIDIGQKMITNVVEKVTHESQRNDLFSEVLSHTFYYF